MPEFQHKFAHTNGIRMHYVQAGTGPLVIFCHGFPESWYSWRHQLRAFADRGFRAIAPDQRGYGETDAPAGLEAYDLCHLVGDMVGLLYDLGERACDHRRPRLGLAGRLDLRPAPPRSVPCGRAAQCALSSAVMGRSETHRTHAVHGGRHAQFLPALFSAAGSARGRTGTGHPPQPSRHVFCGLRGSCSGPRVESGIQPVRDVHRHHSGAGQTPFLAERNRPRLFQPAVQYERISAVR